MWGWGGGLNDDCWKSPKRSPARKDVLAEIVEGKRERRPVMKLAASPPRPRVKRVKMDIAAAIEHEPSSLAELKTSDAAVTDMILGSYIEREVDLAAEREAERVAEREAREAEAPPISMVAELTSTIENRPSARDTSVWKDSPVGHLFISIWKQLYCRNAQAEFKLSREGLIVASSLVYSDGSLINGKHYRFDEARTFEHIQLIIDRSIRNGAIMTFEDQPYLPALLIHLIVGKMYKSRELQIRMTNSEAEPPYSAFANSRKAGREEEAEGQHEPKARSAKDQRSVREQIAQLKAHIPSELDVPNMQAMVDWSRTQLDVGVETLIQGSRWKWNEPTNPGHALLMRISNAVALYCSLANKARSFGLSVGALCAVPLPIGPK
jgi:hypothetical protein